VRCTYHYNRGSLPGAIINSNRRKSSAKPTSQDDAPPTHSRSNSNSTAATASASTTGSGFAERKSSGVGGAGNILAGGGTGEESRWVESITALGMWSQVRCAACGYGVLDEEVSNC
jgi:hypothetical protein